MNEVYLLTGGNIGDRSSYLSAARNAIENYCGLIVSQSAIYETEAWGIKDQPAFLNQALAIQTEISAHDLLIAILEIEHQMGRKREVRYGPRMIDIDILLFNNDIIHSDNLVIPHPEMQNRRFALQCLFDIAAHKNHPVLHKSIAQLLADCTDPLTVNKFN